MMEKRLIDANELKERLYGFCGELPRSTLAFAHGQINCSPTIDAVEVPCKIGQVVYMQYRDWDIEMNIQPFQITSIMISQNKKGIWTKKFRASWAPDGKTRDLSHNVPFDDIGKTVFFTKEEAEKAWEAILAERRSDESDER